MYKYWSSSGWQKGTSRDEATLNSEEIKPIALVVIELCLCEGISQSVSQIVSQSAVADPGGFQGFHRNTFLKLISILLI